MNQPAARHPLRRHARRLLLPLLCAASLAASLTAIGIDDLPSQPADSLAMRATRIHQVLKGEFPVKAGLSALSAEDKIPPLPFVVPGLLMTLFGSTLFAMRLGGVLCLALLMLQCRDLARLAGAGRRIAWWAALLCATAPMLFGWSRLAYADIYVAVFHAGCLQLMARGYLTPRRAVLLGMVGGLGVLSKLSFFVYMLPPALYFLVAHLRLGRKQLLNLGLMVLSAAAVSGWWLFMRFAIIYDNFFDSVQGWKTSGSFMFGNHNPLELKAHQVEFMLWQHPGLALLWASAGIGLLLWRKKPLGHVRALLGLGSLMGLATLMLFDPGARYLVPIMPAAVVLMALAAERLLRLDRTRFRLLEGALLLALLGWFGFTNLVFVPENDLRFNSTGMLTPINLYDKTCRELRAKQDDLSVVFIEGATAEWLMGIGEAPGRSCSFPRKAPDPSKLCQMLITFSLDKDGSQDSWGDLPPGRCPDLALMGKFGKLTNLRIAVITPEYYLGQSHRPPFWTPGQGHFADHAQGGSGD